MDGHPFESPERLPAPPSPDDHVAEAGAWPRSGVQDTTPDAASIPAPSVAVVLDALLRAPARLLATLGEGRGWGAITALAIASILATGLALASWSGGAQLALVPLKLVLLTALTGLVCLPSLHVLTALGGGTQPVRDTASSLAMGIALAAVLAVALVPIAWVLSAATSSLALAGTLYLVVFLVSVGLGLGLVKRALRASAGAPLRGLGAWSVVFVLVALQLATTLRPLVGPAEATWLAPRTFFLSHLVDCLGT